MNLTTKQYEELVDLVKKTEEKICDIYKGSY